jgi:hypothetical protein
MVFDPTRTADPRKVGEIVAKGTAVDPTTISVNESGYKIELRRVIKAMQTAVDPVDGILGNGNDVTKIVYNYGGGLTPVTLPGGVRVQEITDATKLVIASDNYKIKFAGFLPGTVYTRAKEDELDAFLTTEARKLRDAVTVDFALAGPHYKVVSENSSADVRMTWLVLYPSLGETQYDTLGIKDSYLKGILAYRPVRPVGGLAVPPPDISEAAVEYALAESLNPKVSNTGKLAIPFRVQWTSGATFAEVMANTVSHELAHTFGVNDAYHENSVPDPNAPINPPKDIMQGATTGEGNLTFGSQNVNLLKAALGIQADGDTPLTAETTMYRANINLPGDTVGELHEYTGPLLPELGVRQGTQDILPDGEVTFGKVAADGAGGALRTIPLTLKNSGFGVLNLNTIALAHGDRGFKLITTGLEGTVLAQDATTTLTLAFDPSVMGSAEDLLTVGTNGATLPLQGFRLTGTAIAAGPRALVRVGNNNFGGAPVGGASLSSAVVYTIESNGSQPLVISGISLSEGSSSIQLTGLPVGTKVLAPGESLSFGATFTAGRVGLERAAIDVTTNDPSQPVLHLGAVGTGLESVVSSQWGNDYVAIEFPNQGGAQALLAKSDEQGNFSFFLPARQAYHLAIFDPSTGLIAHSYGTTPASGRGLDLTGSLVFGASTAPDTDGDGLPDDVEFAIGTSVRKADTDGNGLSDFVAIQQGLDPFGGRAFPTGVIASLPLAGEAKAVTVVGSTTGADRQTAYVATGSAGLAIVNASRFQKPLLLGQLDLPGDATDVAVDDNLRIAAVATNAGGLALINVADPVNPVLLQIINVATSQVEVVDGIAYAATGDAVRAYDLLTGEELEKLDLGGSNLTRMAREGGFLYTMDNANVLRAIDLSGSTMTARDSLVMPGGSGELFVGNGVAYVGTGAGFTTASVADPNNLILLSGADANNLAARAVVANGSGIAVSVGNTTGNALDVLNVSDPTNTGRFVTQYALPAAPSSVVLASGIAFVADGTAGLQVVNYLPFDTKGVAPTVSISTNAVDMDAATPGIQVQEGKNVVVRATISDDVQVGNVELLINGTVVQNDVTFPFDLTAALPLLASGTSTAKLQVRATDTGGNSTLSAPVTLRLVPDTFAPAIIATNPPDGTSRGVKFRSFSVSFSEPMDEATLTAANFQLTGPGGPVTPVNVQFRHGGSGVQLTYPSLALGNYQTLIHGQAVKDRVGNALGTGDITSTFTIRNAQAVWTNPLGGFWDDPSNWDTNAVPGAEDAVLIDVPGNVTITHRQGNSTIKSLSSTAAVTISGGVLTVTGTVQVNNTFTLSGGTLKDATVLAGTAGASFVLGLQKTATFDGVTLGSDFLNDRGTLNVLNGLTLTNNATLNLVSGPSGTATASFNGSQTLGGNGTLLLSGTLNNSTVQIRGGNTVATAATLTLGAGVTVRYAAGSTNAAQITSSFSQDKLLNLGTITAEASGKTLTVNASGGVTNQGTMRAISGGSLSVTNLADAKGLSVTGGGTLALTNFGNTGTITATDSTLTLDGTWTNAGTLTATNSTVNLDGAFTLASLGTFQRTGGTVNLNGVLDLTGNTLALNAVTGSWNLVGGTIKGGTITASGGASLGLGLSKIATFDGVTLGSDFLNDRGTLNVLNGLTLTNNATLNLVSGPSGNGIASFNGSQTFGGNGTVLLSGTLNSSIVQIRGGNTVATAATLTIGAGVAVRYAAGSTNASAQIISSFSQDKLLNLGTITAEASGKTLTVNASGGVTNQGTMRAIGGGTLSVSNLAPNAGVIEAGAGSLVTINGSFTQVPAGTLRVEIGGTSNSQFGRINVTGIATLDGLLDLKLVNAFTPAVGNTFKVLTYSSHAGAFATITDNDLLHLFSPTYNVADLTLTVV